MLARSFLVGGFALLACASISLSRAPQAAPTFSKDVAPILYRSCVQCHRPGEIGPFSLVGYANAKQWSKMIATVTGQRLMPPWKDSSHGTFLDENRLTAAEVSTLKAWDAAGAPRGSASEEPKEPTFSSGWTLGEPNAILKPAKAVRISAEGRDEYRNYVLKTNFTETRYLSAIDCKPGNKRIVHHLVVYVDLHGAAAKLEREKGDGQGGYVTEGGISPGFEPDSVPYIWAPGERARFMPAGVGFELKPGATLVMQVHYHKDGKPESDLTSLGLYFAKEKPKKLAEVGAFLDPRLKVPAGKVTTWEKTYSIPFSATMYSIMPHMHLLGQSMKAELILPNGKVTPLVDVEQWDYNWQLNYAFKEPIKIPAGSKIHVSAAYDNTSSNPRNPASPPKDVRWGEQTNDEMFVLIFTITAGQ